MGYLMRVARANGYETLRQLGNTFRNFEGLCQALGLSAQETQGLLGPHPSFWGPSTFSNGLAAIDFNHSQMRWCPLCLRESAHLRGLWLLKISCICNRHSIRLHERCHSCGSTQRLERVNLEQCACGAWLADTRGAYRVDEPLVSLSRAIHAAMKGKSALAGFPAMSLPEWIRLIGYLGQYSETYQPTKPGKIANLHQLDTATTLMHQVSRLLDGWPENFHVLLMTIQRQADSQSSIRRTFGSLYRTLYKDVSGECFQFLRDAFEGYLHEHWSGVVNKRHKAFKLDTIARHPRVTLKQAAKKAGVTPSTVRHFVRVEVIAGNQIELPSGRKLHSIDEQSLKQIAVLAKGCVTLGEAAKQLALPKRRIRELISAGILKPLVSRAHGNAATWLIPKQQLQALFFDGTESSKMTQTISVRYILKYWHLRDGEFQTLVRALFGHQLEPVGKPTESVPLGNILLDEQQTWRWLAEKRFAGGASISVDEAAQRLGLKQQVVYDLVRLGLLATIEDALPGRRVTQASLDDFQATYVSLAEYAGALKKSPRWLLQTLPVRPISGPMIDGSRQYFYRRAELYP
ncbi:regulatory protein MerR [Methylomonas methanica MC09]|uniref:Regulatory protein MerR n=2 Tax=Methylomonas methanica TaxID=421 RepID=F9ZX11_METMM|nr:regulatory protein MerR [Methylomonas methanica MC09]